MKLFPTLRNIGVALAVIPMVLLVVDSFLENKIIEDTPALVMPFFITVGTGIALAIIAQKNMPRKEAYKFEQSE